jgi:hypothetical protein
VNAVKILFVGTVEERTTQRASLSWKPAKGMAAAAVFMMYSPYAGAG